MSRHLTTIPRSSIFTLEDGTWVVQRGVDHVQELLTHKERIFSSMDVSFEITDEELGMLREQGIIVQYDEFFVWLKRELVETALLEMPLGISTYYYVQTGLDSQDYETVRARLEMTGLSDRYEVAERFGAIVLMGRYEEPFSNFQEVEDAQILLAPVLHDLTTQLNIIKVRSNTAEIPPIWSETPADSEIAHPLIHKMAPELYRKNVVCIDREEQTHEIIGQICDELGVEVASAYTAKDGMILIQDTDPALIIMELTLPDLHGYEIVAFVRNNPELAQIPIIIVASLDSETDRALALTVAKVKDYVIKPFKVSEFRRRIWQLLNQRSV